MSEVISNEQQEQNQTENQQQNVNVPVQNPSQSQQQPAEQRQEEKRQLTIDTNLPQPTSPRQGSQGDNTQNISSPRADGSQRVIKQQSPGLLKGKLDVLRNLYNQKLEEFNAIDKSGSEKEQQIEDLKTALSDAQRNQTEKVNNAAQQVSEKNQTISDLEARLNNLKSSDIASVHSQRVAQIHAQISNASQKLYEREADGKNQIIQAKIAEKVNTLTQSVQNLKNKKEQILTSANEKRSKLDVERNNLESLLNKLIETTKGNNSSKLSELESQHKAVEQEIQNRRQKINKLKSELDAVKNTDTSSTQTPDLSGLKLAVQEVKKTKAQLEKEIEAQQKQFKQVANKLKSNESTIENKKNKNSQLNEKTKKLEEQKNKLEKEVGEGKKKPKFQQKIPEQVLTLRARKAALQKEVKQEIDRTNKQRNKEDNLVPASVIETMKQKIAKAKEQNERYGKLIVENNQLREENVKLDATKEGMEWETSADIKIVMANVQKQQAKHNALEKDIIQIRNKNVQVANKLQEYTNDYPDFKPEKKLKKLEPVPAKPQGKGQQSQVKKEVQQPTKQEGGKKKKGNKSSPQVSKVVVHEVVQETSSPVTPPPKQEPKSGKNKNKSKKPKQVEDPVVEKKVEVVKKQQPVETLKKEQPVKKEEPKVQNKPAPVNQGNKNKKKR